MADVVIRVREVRKIVFEVDYITSDYPSLMLAYEAYQKGELLGQGANDTEIDTIEIYSEQVIAVIDEGLSGIDLKKAPGIRVR